MTPWLADRGVPPPQAPTSLISRVVDMVQSAPAISQPAWNVGERLLGEFRIERKLGSGGMGTVYLVQSVITQQWYAVKKTKQFHEETDRLNFLTELWTWIDLPLHPHLVACRFLRTVGDEIAIFADYISAGSLADWMKQGRVDPLSQILDVAIQTAWGLHALHQLGLVHQDVKPHNVLLTDDGVAKIADFGLARARAVASSRPAEASASPGSSVTAGPGTMRYHSPEQACGERLTRKTDVWSWGVMVLEMFQGEATWPTGQAAPYALHDALKRGFRKPGRPPLPAPMADVLRLCFHKDPAKRWSTMAEVAAAVQKIYQDQIRSDYPRRVPSDPPMVRHLEGPLDRWTTMGLEWDDPREYLLEAIDEEGRDDERLRRLVEPATGSRTAQTLRELAIYEETVRAYGRLVAAGRKDLRERHSRVCIESAFVHRNVADIPGALVLIDRAVELLKTLANEEGQQDLLAEVAKAYINKALFLSEAGLKQAAVTCQREAFDVLHALAYDEGRWEHANELAKVYLNMANALDDLGDYGVAAGLYEAAGLLREWLIFEKERSDLVGELATAYRHVGMMLTRMGQFTQALEIYHVSGGLLKHLVFEQGQNQLQDELARSYLSETAAATGAKHFQHAVDVCNRAISILGSLIQDEHREDLMDQFAKAQLTKAQTLHAAGEPKFALDFYNGGIAILKNLVEYHGRSDLLGELHQAEEFRKGVSKSTEE